jgi:hypothetical protein
MCDVKLKNGDIATLSVHVPIMPETIAVCNSTTFMITLYEIQSLNRLYSPHNVPPAVCSSAPLLKSTVRKDIVTLSRMIAVANSLHIPDAVREYTKVLRMANDMLPRAVCLNPVPIFPREHIPIFPDAHGSFGHRQFG